MNAYDHEIVYKATKEQLQDVIEDWIHRVKKIDPDMAEDLECDLYEKVNGQHFDRVQYDRAMSQRGYDSERGRQPKWQVEQVSDYARRAGDRFDRYNEYDLSYEMNTLHGDYASSLGDSPETYYRMAKERLDSREEPDGRAWRDYRAESYARRRRDRMGRFASDDRRYR